MKTIILILCTVGSIAAYGQIAEAWQNHLPYPFGGVASAKRVFSDYYGNVFSLNQSADSSFYDSILLSKHNRNTGSFEWSRTVDTASGDETFRDLITMDSMIYICGVGVSKTFLKCFNNTGMETWSYEQNIPGNPTDITMDDSGNIHILKTNNRIEVWKISPTGNLLQFFKNDTLLPDSGISAKKIIVNENLDVFVAGNYFENSQLNTQFFIKKFNQAGQVMWAKRFNPGGHDELLDITLDDSSNVYLIGTQDISSYGKFAIVKFDSAGNQKWNINYGALDARPYSFATDSVDYLYVSGMNVTSSTSGSFDILKINIHRY